MYNNIYSHTQNRNTTLSNDQYQEVLNSLDSEEASVCVQSNRVCDTCSNASFVESSRNCFISSRHRK